MTVLTCPFCLYSGELNLFLIKAGYKTYKCPDCNIKMRDKTLKKEMNIEEYSKWFAVTVLYNVGKFELTKLANRLHELNWWSIFWNTYYDFVKSDEYKELCYHQKGYKPTYRIYWIMKESIK